MSSAHDDSQGLRREAGPLTSRGKARRAVLLEASRRVFEARGFEDARVADIVAEAGVAIGTFYTYFPDKETVFQEIASEVVLDMHRSLKTSDSARGIYELMYQTHVQFVDAYRRNAGIIGLIQAQSPTDASMRELRLQLREGFIGPGARGVARFQQMGLADKDLDPRLTLELIAPMAEELCFQRFVLNRELTDEKTLIELLTRLWLRAIGVDLDVIKERTDVGNLEPPSS